LFARLLSANFITYLTNDSKNTEPTKTEVQIAKSNTNNNTIENKENIIKQDE